MNKTVKRILLGIGVLGVTPLLLMGGLPKTNEMNVIETKEIVHNIFAVNDAFVNMFLLKDGDNYVAIDAGNDINAITTELKKLGINPEKVSAVLLTHSDGDHVGALKLFKNATVYLSKDEEQMIDGKTARMMGKYNKIDTKVYNLLNDQQTIRLGNFSIKGILTPGHTPGSMCYLVNGKYLFVGDAFGLKNGKVDKPNKKYTGDMKTAIQSFDKIIKIPKAQYIFTAHTGYSINYKNATNTTLK